MEATFGIVKRAWIRTPGQPVGKPGLGRISCPCGQAPETNFRPGPNIACPCGITYTWDGYVVKQEQLDEFKANRRGPGRPRKPICPHCKGTGQKVLSHTMMCACPHCDGSGKRKEKSA